MIVKSEYSLERLRAAIPDGDLCVPDVSKWSVGMHIHHCGLSMVGVCRALASSKPPAPSGRFSPITWFIFLTGRIPRGRARAPDAAVPKEDISRGELASLLDKSEQMLAQTAGLDAESWFKHPILGVLKRDKATDFLILHNRHHLRIVSDILAAR